MAGTMQRSDVVLADLEDFLRSQARSVNTNNTKLILAVASDTSSLLPCCRQSLGELFSSYRIRVTVTANMPATCRAMFVNRLQERPDLQTLVTCSLEER